MQHDQKRAHDAREYMNFEPDAHATAAETLPPFAQSIEHLGAQHQQKSNNSKPVSKTAAGPGRAVARDDSIEHADARNCDPSEQQFINWTAHGQMSQVRIPEPGIKAL